MTGHTYCTICWRHCPVAPMTGDRKLGSLPQQNVLSRFWRAEVQHWFHGAGIKPWAGLCSLAGLLGSPHPSSSWGCLQSWARGCFTPVGLCLPVTPSSSTHITSPLGFSPTRTLSVGFKAHRIIQVTFLYHSP